ncbi:MAG: DNA-binding response regulator [Rhodospirillaceae bacterium]|nr:MAG: DNA-binding response regulator [Rhodospirillaceae bacterium]
MKPEPHILIVDDNREIRDLVSRFLIKEGYRTSTAFDGKIMRKALKDGTIDLIILDVMLPGEDGLSLCRQLRVESNIPIIMLTAKGEEIDRIIGLEMGADDYIAKPFSPRELLARIKAVLRRSQAIKKGNDLSTYYHFSGWTLNTTKRELLSCDDVVVPLSTGEYNLLTVLLERPKHVLNRNQLLDMTRGRSYDAFDRSIDTQVSRLRRKIEDDPKKPELIKTVWGGGYIFTPDVTST